MVAIDVGPWGSEFENDLDALTVFQNILLQAAEGTRHAEIDNKYRALRTNLLRNEEYSDVVPRPIRQNRDLAAFWAEFQSFNPQWEPRRQWIREQFAPLFDRAEVLERSHEVQAVDAQSWTGFASRGERLKTVQTLLPLAQSAIEGLIDQLSQPGDNGGPILDERAEAIEQLRQLHAALGSLLDSIETGRFDDELGSSLAADAARYAKRAVKVLKDDPMPYLAASLLLGIFSACGFPGIGGYLSGVALTIRQNKSE